MQKNYPDYNRISEIEKELSKIAPLPEDEEFEGFPDLETEEIYDGLVEKLEKLVTEEPVEANGKSCKENHCRARFHRGTSSIYYPGKVHHLDGDITNDSSSNLAMVCPLCQAHILLSRFSPEDIWLLKARGLSNAEIGRLLSISRERVRQLCKKYEVKHEAELTALLEANLDDLVKKAEYIENHLIANGRLKRRIDRRTKKKRVIAELNKLKAKGDTR